MQFGERVDVAQVEEGVVLAPRFDADGLIQVVTTDATAGEVLMVATMNREALALTIELGEAVYWSRSRVPDRAEAPISHWEERLARVVDLLPADEEPVPAFSYGWGQDTPGGGLGLTIVAELYRHAGAVNVFEDLLEMWGTVSWEAFVESQPEVIVVTDYGNAGDGQSGEQKIEFLKTVEGVDTVPAVQNDRFLVLPQEAVNPGIRIVDGVEALAAYLYPDEFTDLVGTSGFGLSEVTP